LDDEWGLTVIGVTRWMLLHRWHLHGGVAEIGTLRDEQLDDLRLFAINGSLEDKIAGYYHLCTTFAYPEWVWMADLHLTILT